MPNSEIYLGMILCELNFITTDGFNESLVKMAETNKLQGQVLMEMGKITKDQLKRALYVQQLRKLSQLIGLGQGTYKFTLDAKPKSRLIAYPIHPFPVIYQGVRNNYDSAELDRWLKLAADSVCRTKPSLNKYLELLQAPDEDLADLELLDGRLTIAEFVNIASCGSIAAKMMLLVLDWFELLSFGKTTEQAAEPKVEQDKQAVNDEAQRSPTSSKQTLPTAVRDRIEKKYLQAQQGDYFALLEINIETDPESIKASVNSLNKIFHPDRVIRYGDDELVKKVSLISSQLQEAAKTLSQPELRNAYLSQLGCEDNRPVTINPEAAAVAYQKAKVFLQKKKLFEALDSMVLAVRFDPSKYRYRARAIWLEYQLEKEKTFDKRQKVKRDLMRLFEKAPGNFWINRYLATIASQLKDAESYEKHLLKASRIRPDDIEVAREIRLMNMRKSKKGRKG